MIKQFILTALTVFLLTACRDPIFYDISLEERILEPRIKGSPTNFVEFKGFMYVASGDVIYKYLGKDPNRSDRGMWNEPQKPGGAILQLAATDSKLYALCRGSSRNELKESNDGENWIIVNGTANLTINSVYSANNQLFLGTGTFDSFRIRSGAGFAELINTGNSLLNGVAFANGTYYFSVNDLRENGGGIYTSADLSQASLIREGVAFMGIINLNNSNNTIVAIARNGSLYSSASNFSTRIAYFGNDKLATGALAVRSGSTNLLLAGRQDQLTTSTTSGNTYGYLELDILANGPSGDFTEPGTKSNSTITLGDNGRFRTTIGKFPINHIYQASDGTLFASTQKNGVWSFRNRSSTSTADWYWNAEQADD